MNEMLGIMLPTIVSPPKTILQKIHKLLFRRHYNKRYAKRFPKLSADDILSYQSMSVPTDLKFELSFEPIDPENKRKLE